MELGELLLHSPWSIHYDHTVLCLPSQHARVQAYGFRKRFRIFYYTYEMFFSSSLSLLRNFLNHTFIQFLIAIASNFIPGELFLQERDVFVTGDDSIKSHNVQPTRLLRILLDNQTTSQQRLYRMLHA